MQIDQNFPEGAPRKLTVQGAAYNVKIAKDMIDTVMEKVRLPFSFFLKGQAHRQGRCPKWKEGFWLIICCGSSINRVPRASSSSPTSPSLAPRRRRPSSWTAPRSSWAA